MDFVYVDKLACHHRYEIQQEPLHRNYAVCFECGTYTVMHYEKLEHRLLNTTTGLATLAPTMAGVSALILSLLAMFGVRF